MADDLSELSDDEFREKLAEVLALARNERQENQIVHYKSVSQMADKVWESDSKVVGVGGGNRSSKTDTCLALLTACATGMFPDSMRHLIDRRFRGPIRIRIICDSLTTTLYPVILPKLQWWKWSGADQPGGERGHWGWIPPYCLKDRLWEKSWSEKFRILTVICRDPRDPNIILGESVFHFMSYDQEEGRGTDFHFVMHDEPPPLHIWRESEARVMGVAGRLLLAMTWPDDPAIPIDWLFDEIYEPGIDPSNKQIEWINMYSTDNPNVDQESIAIQSKNWTEETRRVRIYGQPIRFSNRVHPLFTDQTQHWCFGCGRTCFTEKNEHAVGTLDANLCASCGGTTVMEFNHVKEFEVGSEWPAIWAADPHPRKDHMALWVVVDPADDLWVIDEMLEPGDASDVRFRVDEIEQRHGLMTSLRLMDPNMGETPGQQRNVTWRNVFDEAGLPCEMADDSAVGRATLNQYLKPDERRLQPRIHVHPRCKTTISQIKRYSWDDYKRSTEKDQKQTPKAKNDDFPTLLKYVMNYAPTFSGLKHMGRVFSRVKRN